MDRLGQLRGEAGGSRDSTMDTSSPPSEAYMTANENSSKYFSLSEVDSTFDISSIKDVSQASTAETERTVTNTDRIISNLSPIGKNSDLLDSYKIGKQIEAANILSGGVDIFDDNDNSYDGNELVIDDNVAADSDEKSNTELKLSENSMLPFQKSEGSLTESSLLDTDSDIASKDTEVVLQIDGKNVDAIDIGNGLYLYRREGEEELAAVQIIDDDQQQPSFKFLKVRENTEGNLEVYEEIEIEVPKEVPIKEGKPAEKITSHVPIKDINEVISDQTSNKVAESKTKSLSEETSTASNTNKLDNETNKDPQSECKTEVNLNGKMMKFSESRKSPLIGTFTPMTFHSTPNKEGIPLTKTMVDLQLHPNRHSDNVKKTIEVHTDSCKQRLLETPTKDNKDLVCDKATESISSEKEDNSKEKASVVSDENGQNKEISKDTTTHEDIAKLDEKNVIKPDEDNTKSHMEVEKSVVEKTLIPKVEVEKLEKVEAVITTKKEDIDSIKTHETESKPKKGNKDENISVINSVDNISKSSLEDKPETEGTELAITHTLQEKEDKTSESNKDKNDTSLSEKVDDTCSKEIGKSLESVEEAKIKTYLKKEDDKARGVTETSKEVTDSQQIIQATESKPQELSTKESENDKETTCSDKIDTNKTTVSPVKTDLNDENRKHDSCEVKTITDNKIATDSQSEIFKDECTVQVTVDSKLTQEQNVPNSKKTEQEDTEKARILKEDELRNSDLSNNESKVGMDDDTVRQVIEKKDTVPIVINSKREPNDKKDIPTAGSNVDTVTKSVNNIHAAVPFGKWTEANRQEFLNKIKESKVSTSSNTNQIKQPNDLNRRDILKKIDSQRQSNNATVKAQDFSSKLNIKKETAAFVNRNTTKQDSKIPIKAEAPGSKNKPSTNKKVPKQESDQKSHTESSNTVSVASNVPKKETVQRKEINNQDLIDKTIEGIINRAVPVKAAQDYTKQNVLQTTTTNQKVSNSSSDTYQSNPTDLDAIEMKMNELHGIPFVERPPHELPKVHNHDLNVKTYIKPEDQKSSVNKINKIPKLLPLPNKNQQKSVKDGVLDVDSEEEIIEHEPITGDIELSKKIITQKVDKETLPDSETVTTQISSDASKKEAFITENEFDKFARRNSITYENCLTVNFEGSEPHNVVQTVKEKDIAPVKYNRNEMLLAEAKAKSPHKQTLRQNNHPSKIQNLPKYVPVSVDTGNKNYQSKLQIAYQSALTAKRQMEFPITVIEDKPVKVVFMDSNDEFIPSQLNVQGQELSPPKKQSPVSDTFTQSTCDSIDSDILDATDEGKTQDDSKIKTKHQRKQVLTPVDTPELELIEPSDIGIDVSPKKKRKTEEYKIEKIAKNVVPKKSYLLGRNQPVEETKPLDVTKNPLKETINRNDPIIGHKDAVSAIDNLVKAAELIETQSENINTSINNQNTNSQPNTPVKRGRGRPRKNPIPEGSPDKNKVPSPQKKPRLIEKKVIKHDTSSEEDSSDEEIVKENWTMGKINENIVCPICNKLFRSENVVFKHVKHCTGPSPNRSDSDKRSPRRYRQSHESEEKSRDSKSDDMDVDREKNISKKETPKNRKSRDSTAKVHDDIIVIEDTPVKQKLATREKARHESRRFTIKSKDQNRTDNLVCEFCGKTFRQLSYLVNHKLQHKKDDSKKFDNDTHIRNKSVFSCDVCKKEFRKLHHLVQHRIIHNPSSAPSRLLRKSSSEQNDSKAVKNNDASKQSEDQSAGFRCEPCDKSFRKLHHLVEHRETHGGITRQKNTSTNQTVIEKPAPPPQCEICKKTFRKLHHLIEHKEQHLETSSEKSDDKSVKSTLSTKDIIHECSLCYMVFPNEHSLTKHTVICQRKKRQSAAKQAKLELEKQTNVDNDTVPNSENKNEEVGEQKLNTEEKLHIDESDQLQEKPEPTLPEKIEEVSATIESKIPLQEESHLECIKPQTLLIRKDVESKNSNNKIEDGKLQITADFNKMEDKQIKIPNVSKKKTPSKDKMAPTVTKRQKTNLPLPVKDVSATAESSDDDEVRYMLNPDFKDDTSQGKVFMKVRAKKRNSLQIERPNSRDLVKRRTSLQHPPKIPRLKPKPVEPKVTPTNTPKVPKLEPVLSTDSDDSDVKYSFPKTVQPKVQKSLSRATTSKVERKTKRKSLTEKRKSLSGIAKRKSLGKAVVARHKVKPTPVTEVKRRTKDVEHRCDCGQLFSSAALLSRHTTLAHTPPRIRRNRSPPKEIETKTRVKTTPRKTNATDKVKKSTDINISNIKSSTRKSSVNKSEAKTSSDRKSGDRSESVRASSSSAKPRRSIAHRGVPVPEKMRKLMEKSKK